jgi:hypothetical protein
MQKGMSPRSLMPLGPCRFGFIGPVELSTSAFLFANLAHVPSERWRERFLAEALKFRVSVTKGLLDHAL